MNPAVTRSSASRASSVAASVSQTISRIGLLQVVIIALAVVTALVHLDKALTTGFPFGHPVGPAFGMPSGMMHGTAPGGAAGGASGAFPGHGANGTVAGRPPMGRGPALPLPLSVLFFLNFLGYIALTAALYLPVPILQRYQNVTRWVLIAFTAVTIWAYFAIMGASNNAFGGFDKAAEISLIVFLLFEVYWVWDSGHQASA